MKKTAITAMMIVVILTITLTQAHAIPNTVIGTISVNDFPRAVAVNEFTNRVYVANGGSSHTITVINTVNDANTIIGTIPVGHDPSAIAVNESTNRIYVTNSNSHTVTVINTLNDANAIIGTIPVGLFPSCVAINKSTNRLYVGRGGGTGVVTVVNTLNDVNAIIGEIPVGNLSGGVTGNFPEGIAVNETTNRVYVSVDAQPPDLQLAHVTVINTLNDVNTVIDTIPVGANPRGLALNESTNRLYVAILFGPPGNVTVIDTLNNAVIDTIPTGLISGPLSVAVNKFSKRVYVANLDSKSIAVIDTDINQIIETIFLDGEPNDIAVNISKNRAYVVNRDLDTVSVIETEVRYRFVVMADSRSPGTQPGIADPPIKGINKVVLENIMRSVKAINDPPPAFILFGGDLVWGMRTGSIVENQLTQWKNVVDGVMGGGYARSRIYPAFGGHEQNNIDDDSNYPGTWSAFSKVFDPVNDGFLGPSSSTYFNTANYGNTVYYLDYQNARFFVLNNDLLVHELGNSQDTKGTEKDQVAWIRNNNLNNQPLNFFTQHEPAYGAGRNTTDIPDAMDRKPQERNEYIQLVGTSSVNKAMIFSGHEHRYMIREINQDFARMPINNPTPVPTPVTFPGEFYEIVTGGVGANFHYVTHPSYDDGANITPGKYHYIVIDVTGTNISGNVYGFKYNVEKTLRTVNPGTPITISPPVNTGTITFHIDNVNSGSTTGLSGIEVYENNTNIARATSGASVNCSSGISTCNNAIDTDANYTTNWTTTTNETKGAWITLTWSQPHTINKIVLHDRSDTTNYIKGGTLIILDENGIPVKSRFNNFSHAENGPGSTNQDIDADQDGVINSAEGGTENDTDSDGIPDFQDPDTAQTTLATGAGTVIIDAPEGRTLSNVKTPADTDLSVDQQTKPNRDFPYGLIGMDIQNVTPGGTVEVTLTFPSNIPTDYQYWKYGFVKNCDNLKSGTQWYNLNDLGRVEGLDDGDNQITITLTDGSCGDGDGEANGTIRDLGGLTAPKPEIVNNLVNFTRDRSSYKTTTDTTGCADDIEIGQTDVYVGQFSFDATLKNIGTSITFH